VRERNEIGHITHDKTITWEAKVDTKGKKKKNEAINLAKRESGREEHVTESLGHGDSSFQKRPNSRTNQEDRDLEVCAQAVRIRRHLYRMDTI
jgi:hypothetical protein